MDELPLEVLHAIVSRLDVASFLRMAQVSRQLHALCALDGPTAASVAQRQGGPAITTLLQWSRELQDCLSSLRDNAPARGGIPFIYWHLRSPLARVSSRLELFAGLNDIVEREVCLRLRRSSVRRKTGRLAVVHWNEASMQAFASTNFLTRFFPPCCDTFFQRRLLPQPRIQAVAGDPGWVFVVNDMHLFFFGLLNMHEWDA